MTFSSNVAYWGNAVLNHKGCNQEVCLSFFKMNLNRQNVDEETIKNMINEVRLIFQNHYVMTSHFVNFINTNRMANDQKGTFFYNLFIFMKQFYPNNELCKNINNPSELMELFNKCYRLIDKLFEYALDNNSLESVRKNIELINRIEKFYALIEDFMIRFYGYSIIGISNQKHIVTACSNCDKKFIDQLMEGYSLFRLQKVGLIESKENPYYEFLPVFPTKDVGFPIEEYIEISNGNRIEDKKLIKVL